mgnify:CR=1 FL=1
MKKKVISILLCAAMCVGMVTACGSKKADKEADSSTGEKDKVITVAANLFIQSFTRMTTES